MGRLKFGNHLASILCALISLATVSLAAEKSESNGAGETKSEADKKVSTESQKVTAPGANSSGAKNVNSVTTGSESATNESATSKSTTEATPSDTSPHQSALPENWVPAKIIEEKPKDKPAPPGQAAAVKLYSQRKFAQAAIEFEKFIKDGTANVETHAYLGYCAYNTRRYTKALQQFDWVAKHCPDDYKLRTSAERYASLLRTEMAGICPQPCLKPNDPRWQRVGDHMEIHWRISHGWIGVTDHHVGQIISARNDQIVNQGTCPTCGGTGEITPLKDGAPLPN